jgi:hypothetical protein
MKIIAARGRLRIVVAAVALATLETRGRGELAS